MNQPLQARPAEDAQELAKRVRAFVDERILPREAELAGPRESARACQDELTSAAREQGLWGLFYPGRMSSLEAYLTVAEQEGRSEYGGAIFGTELALDTHMLTRHGGAEIRAAFLAPLLTGEGVSAYGMSEPDSIGSIPATIATTATAEGDHWRLDGRKWFICRADRATFVTVVARTDGAGVDGALSMILVPTDAPGFSIAREVDILGRFQGQCEIVFDGVRVPRHNLLGQPGAGLALMQERLGLGRLLRAVHWLGLAQRSFDLMCTRIRSARGEQARLGDKQLVRLRVFEAYQAIASARGLLRDAARKFDARVANAIEVNVAKVAASQALSRAVDSAIQVYGAEGLSSLTPLSGIYRAARATHILDGTDDALVSAVGRRLLDAYQDADSLDFDWPSLSGTPAAQ
ncbi:acyl-CoA dehydrogenase family protein [Pseudomonas indica]|uniref:acyl-CoA dehydrogenase family protein n=1 Tax=Pseudomonas indica TaxID=137658 RepID=UPI0023F6F55E|nr:acyl-CoA dehydrogenase [Pseudomonas indica]MBU3057834.1 acyl-CoA dehydrogenase [Pseudomonas indica]